MVCGNVHHQDLFWWLCWCLSGLHPWHRKKSSTSKTNFCSRASIGKNNNKDCSISGDWLHNDTRRNTGSDSDEETFFIQWRLLPESRCSSKLTTIFTFLWKRQTTTRLTFCVSTSVRPIMLIKLFFLTDCGEVQDSTLRPCLTDCSVSQPEQELYNCLLWFVGCQILISKLVYLTCSCGSHSHIRS